MKLQIRNNVFETNSSSTHSITVSGSNCLESLIPKGRHIHFNNKQEFGWEWESYTDIESKASYLWISIIANISCWCDKITSKQELKDRLNKYITKITDYLKEEDIEATFDMPSIELHEYYYASSEGYIDHVNELYGFADEVLKSKEIFFNYLFNPASIIYTGNDNDNQVIEFTPAENEILFWEKNN